MSPSGRRASRLRFGFLVFGAVLGVAGRALDGGALEHERALSRVWR
jgi:hypothetical protein